MTATPEAPGDVAEMIRILRTSSSQFKRDVADALERSSAAYAEALKMLHEQQDHIDAQAAQSSAETAVPKAEVFINPMNLSDGRTDYFVCIRAGDRSLEIHKLREEYQAEYTAAEIDWLLHGGEKPDLMAYSENGWPKRPRRVVG